MAILTRSLRPGKLGYPTCNPIKAFPVTTRRNAPTWVIVNLADDVVGSDAGPVFAHCRWFGRANAVPCANASNLNAPVGFAIEKGMKLALIEFIVGKCGQWLCLGFQGADGAQLLIASTVSLTQYAYGPCEC